jgi:predicted nucleic acid-binding protein
VRVLFDTSVLIPALVTGHQNHAICLPWLQQAEFHQIDGLISTHSLAELYSVLTRLSIKPRPSIQQVEQSLQELLNYLEAIALVKTDYQQAIARMSSLNLPGGGIFDALIAQAALKGNADVLLTLNPKDFTRLGEPIGSKVQVPQ